MKITYIIFFCILLISSTGCNQFPSLETTYTVTASCDSNGYITPTRIVVYKGYDARITITPFARCVVKSIQVEGVYVPIPENNILILQNITSDIKVLVKIEKDKEYYKIIASSSPNGIILPSGEMTVEKGKSKAFECIGNSDQLIDSLIIDGKSMDIPEATRSYSFSYKANDTLTHTIRVVYREKKIYTITAICDAYSTVSTASGTMRVYEGNSPTVQASAKSLCSLVSVKVDGVTITGSSYTFEKINANHTIEVSSKREQEWFLCRGTWVCDSVYSIDYTNNIRSVSKWIYDEKRVFYSNGTYNYNGNSFGRTWNMNKNIIPNTISLSSSPHQILVLNEHKMILYEEGRNEIYSSYATTARFTKYISFHHNTGSR